MINDVVSRRDSTIPAILPTIAKIAPVAGPHTAQPLQFAGCSKLDDIFDLRAPVRGNGKDLGFIAATWIAVLLPAILT